MVPHPDQKAALARAEEALERALGTGVEVRAARDGIRAELQLREPRRAARVRPPVATEPLAQGASRSIRQPSPSRRVAEAVVQAPDLALPELDRPGRSR